MSFTGEDHDRPGGSAGEDDEAFRVAPHPGGEVVHLEEVFEHVRVGGASLHVIEHAELALQQRLAAPCQLRNMSLTPWRTRASSTAALMAVCRTMSIAWPTCPISSLPGEQRRCLGGDVHGLAAAQPGDHGGQLLVRQR